MKPVQKLIGAATFVTAFVLLSAPGEAQHESDETGQPSDFTNSVKGRSAQEAWFGTDKGLAVLADFDTDTWVTYTRNGPDKAGTAVIQRGPKILETIPTGLSIPHNYVLWVEIDGNDAWVGTSKGLGWAIGEDYYAGLRTRPEAETPGSSVASK